MTAVNQNFARKYKIPIDLIGFAFEITEFELPNEVREKPEDGAYIRTRFKLKLCFLCVAKRPYLLKSNQNILIDQKQSVVGEIFSPKTEYAI